ncbi:hypothetical protein FH608_041720 [Nonomuraea phyllanthi]|uniref:Uncharacterized protein n=1 Tax=Nonomuraea phyllanthi TaxID=2219224 RepID=A0A5C4VID5_9ACTN|nr:SUKH-4 family immunity protein [Nonomuraea phyllanthi]KAB8189000.1 hypothetical protein FH608_041720 [Nonomuraea phyllanthi]
MQASGTGRTIQARTRRRSSCAGWTWTTPYATRVTRELLDDLYGQDGVFRPDDGEIHPAIAHVPTRRFLTEVGVPAGGLHEPGWTGEHRRFAQPMSEYRSDGLDELRACAGLPYDLGTLFMLDSMGTWCADDLALELHTYEPEAMAGEDALWPPTLEDYTLLTWTEHDARPVRPHSVTVLRELDERLRDASARMHRAEHVRRLRESIGQQVADVRATLKDLELSLAQEERDVARLEGGPSSVLARLLGNREERLERERAEALVARERVDGHRARLAGLEADAAAADAELAALASASLEHARLLAEKEQQLIRGGDPLARELADLGTALDQVEADLRECEEAHRAGRDARQALDVVLGFLDSARNASTLDVLGGGLLFDAYEHGKLTSADQAAWHAQRALDVFSRELADVGVTARPVMPKMDTRWFVDVFFDNIIFDAIKHQRIEKSRTGVKKLAKWTRDTVAYLEQRRTGLMADRTRLLTRRSDLLRPA